MLALQTLMTLNLDNMHNMPMWIVGSESVDLENGMILIFQRSCQLLKIQNGNLFGNFEGAFRLQL